MWYEIFKFEIHYRARRFETYLFFMVVFLFSIIAFNFIMQGHDLGLIKENAPYVTAKIMAIVCGIFMLITSMIMGVPILRDFEHNIASLIFVNPIRKKDYLMGRFLGSFAILLFVFSGIVWGMVLGNYMPWRESNNLLPFHFWHYLKPFLTIVLPTLFLGASLFFVSGALSRKMIVVYTQGLLFFITAILSHNIDHPFIAAILNPLGYSAIDLLVQSWEISDHNNLSIPLEGAILYNRIFWIVIGLLVLVKGYYSFTFNVVKEQLEAKQITEPNPFAISTFSDLKIPNYTSYSPLKTKLIQLKSHAIFHFKSIIQEASFWAILVCGVLAIFINSINIGTTFGVNSYPTTYLVLEELKEMSLWFFLMILVFYPGEMIWKERTIKIDGIFDALPISDFINLAGKFIGLLLVYLLLLSVLMFGGIAFQIMNGYYKYDWLVYFTGFGLEVFPFLTLFTFLIFFFQAICNARFLGPLLFVVFFLGFMLLGITGLGHGLYTFGGIALAAYSDMNGYGHFMEAFLWFKLYWFAFSIFLFVLTVVFHVRGSETSFKNRWKLSKQRWTPFLRKLASIAIVIFLLSGGYIFYNTNILNTYYSYNEKQQFRANYERTLKDKEYTIQPKIVAVNLKMDLYPKERTYYVEGYYLLENKSTQPIEAIHIQKVLSDIEHLYDVQFEDGAVLNKEHEAFGYSIYTLNQTLAPGDSIRMEFKQELITKGFSESNAPTPVVGNGTFFDNDRLPSLGYNSQYELSNDKDRKIAGLPPRLEKAKRDHPKESLNGKSGDDGSKINFEMIVSTAYDQIAIVPGNLEKEWTEGQRRYFHYKMTEPMINFYSIVSARYEVLHDQWTSSDDSLNKKIDLEIYYHKGHEYNLNRMMHSMKKSFDYYHKNLSSYPYQQMRIMEFPRYTSFAQSFPTTVPYSEAIGFVFNIHDEKDVDMPFFITAHEIAHQWWGLHLVAANVEGKNMILETLAQYSALMVMKQNFPKEKVSQLLKFELERYLEKRKFGAGEELPLDRVGSQEHIYYGKGAINMFALQDYISEDSVNLALRRFVEDWNSIDGKLQKDRYPTTLDLLDYFRAVTPDSLQYVVTDLFETNILYDNEITKASFSTNKMNQYKINLNIKAAKYQSDSLGTLSSIEFEDWIDIGIYAKGNENSNELIYLEKHKITSSEQVLELTIVEKPSKVAIDPFIKRIDKNIENNTISIIETQ